MNATPRFFDHDYPAPTFRIHKICRVGLIAMALVGYGSDRAWADEIEFKVLSAEETGIGSAMEHWYALEMKRQGGPGKQSHGWWPWGLRALDYDRDGDLDLLPSHHGVPGSIVLKSLQAEKGDIRFIDATTELSLDNREMPGADDRPWIWDIDGDGWLDIGGFSDESKPSSVWNQQGKKLVATADSFFRPLSHPREIVDLDGDGWLDVDGGHKGRWFYVPDTRTFRHDETPRFPVPTDLPVQLIDEVMQQSKAANNRFFRLDFLAHDLVGYDDLGYSPKPIDLNDDGRGDLVVHGSGGYGAVYLGRYLIRDETGSLSDQTDELGLPKTGAPILISDLNGDGRTDVLIVERETGGLYLQNATGKFTRQENALTDFLTKRGPYLIRVREVDFDNDGDSDLVASNPRLGREAVFENRGDGEFVSVLETRGWDANPIVICDLDHDGRMDLVIGGSPQQDRRKMEITIYLNATKVTGNFCKITPRLEAPNPFAVGAVAEIFPAGKLAIEKAVPTHIEKAHPDATPIHIGLGTMSTFDLRVTFPNGKIVSGKKLRANSRLTVDGVTGMIKQNTSE